MGGAGPYGGQNSSSNYGMSASTSYGSPAPGVVHKTQDAGRPGARGMQLGRKMELAETIKADEGIRDVPVAPMVSGSAAMGAVPGKAHSPNLAAQGSHMGGASGHAISVTVEEKVSVTLNRDGGVENLEVKGELGVRVTDPSKATMRLQLQPAQDPSIQFKNHPNVDRAAFAAQSLIVLKDPSKPFPLNQSVGVLKWRWVSKDEAQVPLSITCWPTPTGRGGCDVTVEYELNRSTLDLKDVVIAIPYGAGATAPPVIKEVEGDYTLDTGRRLVYWRLASIDASNPNGVLEFAAHTEDTAAFFPIHVTFVSNSALCPVEVAAVSHAQTGIPLNFHAERMLSTDQYTVV
jgi:coatomer subunit delta